MKTKYLFSWLLGIALCMFSVGCSKAPVAPQVSAVTVTKAPVIVPTVQAGDIFQSYQDSTPVSVNVVLTNPDQYQSVGSWLGANIWVFIAFGLALIEWIARITPTATDNTIIGLIKRVLDYFIPNARAGGGALK
jgi:hypothetical protein